MREACLATAARPAAHGHPLQRRPAWICARPPHQATTSSTSAPAVLATAPLPLRWRRRQAPNTTYGPGGAWPDPQAQHQPRHAPSPTGGTWPHPFPDPRRRVVAPLPRPSARLGKGRDGKASLGDRTYSPSASSPSDSVASEQHGGRALLRPAYGFGLHRNRLPAGWVAHLLPTLLPCPRPMRHATVAAGSLSSGRWPWRACWPIIEDPDASFIHWCIKSSFEISRSFYWIYLFVPNPS